MHATRQLRGHKLCRDIDCFPAATGKNPLALKAIEPLLGLTAVSFFECRTSTKGRSELLPCVLRHANGGVTLRARGLGTAAAHLAG